MNAESWGRDNHFFNADDKCHETPLGDVFGVWDICSPILTLQVGKMGLLEYRQHKADW